MGLPVSSAFSDMPKSLPSSWVAPRRVDIGICFAAAVKALCSDHAFRPAHSWNGGEKYISETWGRKRTGRTPPTKTSWIKAFGLPVREFFCPQAVDLAGEAAKVVLEAEDGDGEFGAEIQAGGVLAV